MVGPHKNVQVLLLQVADPVLDAFIFILGTDMVPTATTPEYLTDY